MKAIERELAAQLTATPRWASTARQRQRSMPHAEREAPGAGRQPFSRDQDLVTPAAAEHPTPWAVSSVIPAGGAQLCADAPGGAEGGAALGASPLVPPVVEPSPEEPQPTTASVAIAASSARDLVAVLIAAKPTRAFRRRARAPWRRRRRASFR
jgi:hypothetical protein